MAEHLLQGPSGSEQNPQERLISTYGSSRKYHLHGDDHKNYQQQYGDMYFFRLAKLKPSLKQIATEDWSDFEIGDEVAQHKDRVLDVRQGELCWIIGTIYMDMPLKPNVLEDISKDRWISAPPPREKYLSPDDQDLMWIEDESGRLRLVGTILQTIMLVTGSIVGVMGTENSDGAFEVIDVKLPDLARQPQRWEMEDGDAALTNGTSNKRRISERPGGNTGRKLALVSGLGITGEEGDLLRIDLLMEYLTGEVSGDDDEQAVSKISRLIIAGDSIGRATVKADQDEQLTRKSVKKYGYDASAYNPAPTIHLDNFLATLLPSIPITLLPGETDPVSVAMPQQPLHPAMLPRSRAYTSIPTAEDPGWFDTTTNPWEGDIDGWRFMGNGGQPINDIFKYVEGDDRLDMMESVLRWRIGAPTAPDTLCTCITLLDILILTIHRVLSISRQRAFCDRGESPCLFCWESA